VSYENTSTTPQPIRAAVYVRVSTKPQAGEDKISIPDQLRECRKFAASNDWTIAGDFVDPGISANTIERPGLKRLFESSNTWDLVIAWDFDRFYRDKRSVAGFILDRVDELRKQITSVKQPIPIYDPSTYEPRQNDTPYMLRELAGFTSGLDNRRRFRTLQKGLKERHRLGYMTKPPPYGYQVAYALQDGKPIALPRKIEPTEGIVVKRMFSEYLGGKSFLHIARDLNHSKIMSRSGQLWSGQTIRGIVMNPFYCGLLRVDFHRGKRLKPREEWSIYPGRQEPLISEKDWQAAQELRTRKVKKSRAFGSRTLLAGLLKCGHCGSAMCKEGSWGGGYYVCGKYHQTRGCTLNSFRRIHLEEAVRDYLARVLKDEDIFENVRGLQRNDTAKNARSEIARLQKQLADFPLRTTRLFDLYETGDINRPEFIRRRDQLTVLEGQLRQSIAEKERLVQDLRSHQLTRDMFEELRSSFEQLWDSSDPAERKRALWNLIERITIKDKTFKIDFRLPELTSHFQGQGTGAGNSAPNS
jgi:site-specific DNA recombinase